MITPAWAALTETFSLLKLNITIQLQEDSVLPAFKGSMLHGWFGHALKRADEHAFFVCYGNHDNQQPKPYIICPNEDHKTHWRKGELYHFDITLFGHATQLVDALFKALKYGESLGMGPQRTPFRVLSVASMTPTGLRSGVVPLSLADWLAVAPVSQFDTAEKELAITCLTPTRLKRNGKVCHQSLPDLGEWVQQILRRLVLLSRFWVNDDQRLFDALYQNQPRIGPHQVSSDCYFEDWQRFSHKNKEFLPFGGLKGQVSFCGDIAHVIPLLTLGQALHIGGKTTFGLGKYQLIA
ncbi:CRISPR system precrRNA processing endoribonuclease RAMP protein Cas6 [Salinivibrio sp. HTSP]|uniref:CRISPR system precrRNA processing endoribonuclease RAMP protein Cas6 n=1 Tax=Salinivibrio sp. HTSP TaxID=2115977 RepID=UPI000E30E4FB|nr:CRISPR system precrRNA processing endoribonuclease RAMP protein Cas6 [Salinivibrio sp. HTSP]